MNFLLTNNSTLCFQDLNRHNFAIIRTENAVTLQLCRIKMDLFAKTSLLTSHTNKMKKKLSTFRREERNIK